MMLRSWKNQFVALAASTSLAACGGGGAGSASLPSGAVPRLSNAAVSFVVTVPRKASASASARVPHYLTSNVAGIDFSVTDSTGIYGGYSFFALTPQATYCTTGASGLTCTLQLFAPPGVDTFTVNLYDAPTIGYAYVIGTGKVTATISPQAANTVNIVTNGEPTFATLALTFPYPPVGSPTSTAVNLAIVDPDGNTIIGSFNSPLTLADSDTSGVTALSKTTLNQTSDESGITLTYSGASLPGATITLSGSQNVGGQLASALYQPGVNAPVPSPAILAFAHATSAGQLVTVAAGGSSTGPYSLITATSNFGAACGPFVTVSGTSPTFTVTPTATTFTQSANPALSITGVCYINVKDAGNAVTALPVMISP